jgi:hypothetical protein
MDVAIMTEYFYRKLENVNRTDKRLRRIKMTIDEGIKNLEYGTKQFEMEIESGLWIKGSESELCCKEGIALNKQLIEWLTELKEAKRLLKAAVEDIYKAKQGCNCNICDMPTEPTERCQYENGEDCQFKWLYADEALKLIGDEPNGI